ncbi:MAG: hypothetical protein N3A69_18200, partial [Leptospiraceae bacterium]|nr:hypothetical protein [Leptospiraceae bacterium]
MIPLRDRNPSGNFPFITIALIILNGIMFIYQLSRGEELVYFFRGYALIPAKFFSYGENFE